MVVRKNPPALVAFRRIAAEALLVSRPLPKESVNRPVFGLMAPDKKFVGKAPTFDSVLLLTRTLVKLRNRPIFETVNCPLVNEIAGALVQRDPCTDRMFVKPLV